MGVDRIKRAVFFDRDGVLNESDLREGKPHPPASVRDLRIVSGAREAVARVRDAGFYAIAVTNQPDVARGTAARDSVEAINDAVAAALGLDAVYSCFHDDADGCDCRKPKTGLLERAARERGISLRHSYLVGDRAKDIECGRAAGCTTVFIDFGYDETPPETRADSTVRSISQAVEAIVSREAARA
jgi:D-glycero-D-manno-heptose 1,7-bisphosphate phosphatase